MRGNGCYRGVYLTHLEADVLEQIAEANATSRNFVLRNALRQLAGLPAARLTVPAEPPPERHPADIS